MERCGMKKQNKTKQNKKKNRKGTKHKQPAWKRKIQNKIKAFRGEIDILEDLSNGINVRPGRDKKSKETTNCKMKIIQQDQKQKGRYSTSRIKYLKIVEKYSKKIWSNEKKHNEDAEWIDREEEKTKEAGQQELTSN